MTSIFKKIFGSNKQITQENLQITASVKTYVNGKKIEIPHSRKILREPNLIENISIPPFSDEFDKNIKIQDLKDLRRNFTVNLFQMSCNCPEFQEKHIFYTPNHLRRICQHLKDAIDKPLREKNPFLRKVIIRFYNKPEHNFYYLDFEEKHVLYFAGESYWVNVIAENKPDIEYAYNIIEKRWSSKGIPDKAQSLVSEISKIICLE
ncbi:MAG: hypothetical protein IH618_02615 [Ignavibacteriaceae bacterium]|nr:hypothetical protein [Ignavibacteriaceae bacterium]